MVIARIILCVHFDVYGNIATTPFSKCLGHAYSYTASRNYSTVNIRKTLRGKNDLSDDIKNGIVVFFGRRSIFSYTVTYSYMALSVGTQIHVPLRVRARARENVNLYRPSG